jgi:hypothetical protein
MIVTFSYAITRTIKRSLILLTLSLLGLVGCDEDDTVTPVGRVQNLPAQFKMTGSAEFADAAGNTLTCSLDLNFEIRGELSRSPQFVQFRGVSGGEVFRRILDRTGAGFAFFADTFGEIRADLATNGTVDFVTPINETAEGRFWNGLAHFVGTIDENGNGSGWWTCAPLDIDQNGYVDTALSAQGTWETHPQ